MLTAEEREQWEREAAEERRFAADAEWQAARLTNHVRRDEHDQAAVRKVHGPGVMCLRSFNGSTTTYLVVPSDYYELMGHCETYEERVALEIAAYTGEQMDRLCAELTEAAVREADARASQRIAGPVAKQMADSADPIERQAAAHLRRFAVRWVVRLRRERSSVRPLSWCAASRAGHAPRGRSARRQRSTTAGRDDGSDGGGGSDGPGDAGHHHGDGGAGQGLTAVQAAAARRVLWALGWPADQPSPARAQAAFLRARGVMR